MIKACSIPTSVFVLLCISCPALAQQQNEEDELAAAYGDKAFVKIATGTQQPTNKAPSSATVITARDIEAMGATDISQVLEGVPGVHVSISSEGYFPRYHFRGIGSEFGTEALILINGHKINTNFQGNPSFALGRTLPVENIARIEVIRGPGSALYGADAFSGVINIITKNSNEINGLEFGTRLGSYRSKDAWIQYGGKWGAVDAVFMLEFGKTDGQKGLIQRDLQSIFDDAFHTHASSAPGPVQVSNRDFDARIDLSYENWRMRAGFQDRLAGTGPGASQALDDAARIPEKRFNFDLSYQKANLLPALDLSVVFGYYDVVEKQPTPQFTLLPPGTLNGLFSNGLIGNPGHSERSTRLGISLFYTKFNNHKIRFGIGHEIEDLYATSESKNFIFLNGAPAPIPGAGGQVVDATGNPDLVYLLPHKRSLNYAFIQDEWSIAKDWNLTAGLRHDRYTDFGTTTNPRLALVWDVDYNLIFKMLHGRAFRSPNFAEQYSKNNPTNEGNPQLKPERIKTNELALVWQALPTLQTSATLFAYRQSNLIRYIRAVGSTQARAENTGDQTGKGLELEATWDVNRNLRLSGNYSYQRSTDGETGKDAGVAPHHHLFLRSDYHFARHWQLGTTVNYVVDRHRQPDDPRTFKVPDYVTVDFSLRREKLLDKWDLQASVRNLFNRDARDPSLSPGNIPFDLPFPGRNVYVQLVYKY